MSAPLPAAGVVVGYRRRGSGRGHRGPSAGRPVPVLGLIGGDLCRTLGGGADQARLRSPDAMTFSVDLGAVVADGRQLLVRRPSGRPQPAVAAGVCGHERPVVRLVGSRSPFPPERRTARHLRRPDPVRGPAQGAQPRRARRPPAPSGHPRAPDGRASRSCWTRPCQSSSTVSPSAGRPACRSPSSPTHSRSSSEAAAHRPRPAHPRAGAPGIVGSRTGMTCTPRRNGRTTRPRSSVVTSPTSIGRCSPWSTCPRSSKGPSSPGTPARPRACAGSSSTSSSATWTSPATTAIDATVGAGPGRAALRPGLLRVRRRLGRPAGRGAPGLRAGVQPADQGPRVGPAHGLHGAVHPLHRLRRPPHQRPLPLLPGSRDPRVAPRRPLRRRHGPHVRHLRDAAPGPAGLVRPAVSQASRATPTSPSGGPCGPRPSTPCGACCPPPPPPTSASTAPARPTRRCCCACGPTPCPRPGPTPS